MGDIKIFASRGITFCVQPLFQYLTGNSDAPLSAELMSTKRESIARFIHVILPIRKLYQLPPTSIHIFYDAAGETIAFNRNASIFLNLRYYEAWRGQPVTPPCIIILDFCCRWRGSAGRGFIESLCRVVGVWCTSVSLTDSFWGLLRYFSLAHEIAHNLVKPHNSEHEFYFSSICQKYLPGLSRLILGL